MARHPSRSIHTNTETVLVTAYCLRCKDMITVEAEFTNGAFQDIVPTRHINQFGRGNKKTIYCDCGGEVKIFIPKSLKSA